jgi:hypothetical protein
MGACLTSEAQQRQPFTFEIVPSPREAGGDHWAIRKAGTLVQRSDTPRSTETGARTQAPAMIERLRSGQADL